MRFGASAGNGETYSSDIRFHYSTIIIILILLRYRLRLAPTLLKFSFHRACAHISNERTVQMNANTRFVAMNSFFEFNLVFVYASVPPFVEQKI